jgi:hypothetical protein
MKTTVALGAKKAIVIKPSVRGIRVDLTLAGVSIGGDDITPDQAGALIFGIEQAMEVWKMRLEAQGLSDVPL